MILSVPNLVLVHTLLLRYLIPWIFIQQMFYRWTATITDPGLRLPKYCDRHGIPYKLDLLDWQNGLLAICNLRLWHREKQRGVLNYLRAPKSGYGSLCLQPLPSHVILSILEKKVVKEYSGRNCS